jgi:uncharacterized protein (DUF1697 family)
VRYADFVRNVMIGREGLHASVLIEGFERAGAEDIRSHLSTGNVTYACEAPVDLVRRSVESHVEKVIGRSEVVFVRTITDLAQLVGLRPFDHFQDASLRERCVTFTDEHVHLLLPIISTHLDYEIFRNVDGDYLSFTRLRNGKPGQPGRRLEREIGAPVTTRNWNTIERIVRLER